jgi:hypothetical protein
MVALLSGCSLGGDEEPPRPTGAARQIGVLVRQLELALQRGDAAGVCDDLLTEAARRRFGGSGCERRVRQGLAGVRHPRVELRAVERNGARAVISLRTQAEGMRTGDQRLELRRDDGEWRVEALGR